MKRSRIGMAAALSFLLVFGGCSGTAKTPETPETSVAESSAAESLSGETVESEPSAAETKAAGLAAKKKPGTEAAGTGTETESAKEQASPEKTAEQAVRRTPEAIPVSTERKYEYREIPENEYVSCWADYHKISLDCDDYPELKQALENYNAAIEEVVMGDMESFAEMAADSDLVADDYVSYYSGSNPVVVRADERVVSLFDLRESYAGGAHPSYWYETDTFDTRTGRKLRLEDVLNDPEKLPEILEERFLEEYGSDGLIVDSVAETIREEMHPTSEEFPQGPAFTLGTDRISFYISPYELMSYAAGGAIIDIQYQEMPDLVKEIYQEKAQNTIVQIPKDTEVSLTAGGTVSWTSVPADEDYTDAQLNLVVRRNGAEKTLELWCYSYTGYLISVGDREFLGVEAVSDNDYHLFFVFDLNSDTLPEPVQLSDHFAGGATCSTRVKMERRMDLLSTYSAVKMCRFNEKGEPEALEPWYSLSEEETESLRLTLLQETKFDEVDETTGETLSQKALPKGTAMHILRTDGSDWVDLRLEDGTIVRAYPEQKEETDWTRTVNGIDIWELFDGMMYAG